MKITLEIKSSGDSRIFCGSPQSAVDWNWKICQFNSSSKSIATQLGSAEPVEVTDKLILNGIERYLINTRLNHDSPIQFHINPKISLGSFYKVFQLYGHLIFNIEESDSSQRGHRYFKISLNSSNLKLFKIESGRLTCVLDEE